MVIELVAAEPRSGPRRYRREAAYMTPAFGSVTPSPSPAGFVVGRGAMVMLSNMDAHIDCLILLSD